MDPINKILLGAVGAVVLVAAVWLLCLELANAHLRVQVAEVRESKAACQVANEKFAVETTRQNKAVAALRKSAEKRTDAAAAEMQKRLRAYTLAGEAIGKAQAHGPVCGAAEKLIDDYLRDEK